MNPHDICAYFDAPPLGPDDDRLFAALEALERVLPGVRLERTVTDKLKTIVVTDRRAFLADAMRRDDYPALSMGDGPTFVWFYAKESFPDLSACGQPVLEVQFDLPPMYTDRAAAAMVAVGDACGAMHGYAVRSDAWDVMGDQKYIPGRTISPPLGLPYVKLPDKLPSPYSPMYIGWLNYWSPEAAARFNFPDGPGFDELRARAKKTPAGAWRVQLTDEPLDMGNPAHVDVLRRAYAVTRIGSGEV